MRISKKGISLVELLIGITLTAISAILIMGLLTSSNNIFVKQTIQVGQGLSANQASLEVSNLIQSCAGVVSQYPISGNAQYITSANVLVIKIPSTNSSGQVIDSVFDYAVIVKEPASSKILRKRVFPDPLSSRKSENKVLSTSLKSLNFNYVDSNNSPVTPTQAIRVSFIINLSGGTGLSPSESSASGVVNITNF